MPDQRRTRVGVIYALGACAWWVGCLFYFKAVDHVPPGEVLAHRIIWTAVVLAGVLAANGRLTTAAAVFRDVRTIPPLVATTVLIAGNWYLFIWAVANDRVLDTSLAYYISPLVNVLLGFVILGERFRRLQTAAILLGCAALVLQTVHFGKVPLFSILLALSFSTYGLIRKMMPVDPVTGLAVETAALTPLAVLFLVLRDHTHRMIFTDLGHATNLLLLAGGIVSAVPLAWFLQAAKRLRYSTLGVLQLTMPTMTFLLAVFVYGEALHPIQLVSFVILWTAVALYSVDSLKTRNAEATARPAGEEKQDCTTKRLAPDIFRQRLVVEGFYTIALDRDTIRPFLAGLARHLGMRIYDKPVVYSPAGRGKPANQGYDAFVPLVDSGISVYVWEPRRFFSLLIYSCKPFAEEEAVAYSSRFLRADGELTYTAF